MEEELTQSLEFPATPYSTPKRKTTVSPVMEEIETLKPKLKRMKSTTATDDDDRLLLEGVSAYISHVAAFALFALQEEGEEEEAKRKKEEERERERERKAKEKQREREKKAKQKEKLKIQKKKREEKEKEKAKKLKQKEEAMVIQTFDGKEKVICAKKNTKYVGYSHEINLSNPKWLPLRMDSATPVSIPGSPLEAHSVYALWEGLAAYDAHPLVIEEITKGVSEVPKSKKGNLLGYYTSVTDKTKLSKKEAKEKILYPAYKEQLRAHKSLVKELVSLAPEGVVITDSNPHGGVSSLTCELLTRYVSHQYKKKQK